MIFIEKTDHFQNLKKRVTDHPTDHPSDHPSDGRTDMTSYRDARTHLKRKKKMQRDGAQQTSIAGTIFSASTLISRRNSDSEISDTFTSEAEDQSTAEAEVQSAAEAQFGRRLFRLDTISLRYDRSVFNLLPVFFCKFLF